MIAIAETTCPTTTEAVANYFIDRALRGECSDLTQMKLQKLVYYAHGWHLGLRHDPLFLEPVQAWRYGPVILSLRREFRSFGREPIDRKARDIQYRDGSFVEFEPEVSPTDSAAALLAKVWDTYSFFTPIQLTNMTHQPGTPWHKVASHYGGNIPPGITIPNDLIREHFMRCAKTGAAA